MKFTYKANKYKFKNGKFYIIAGENGLFISKIKDENMIGILTEVLKGK